MQIVSFSAKPPKNSTKKPRVNKNLRTFKPRYFTSGLPTERKPLSIEELKNREGITGFSLWDNTVLYAISRGYKNKVIGSAFNKGSKFIENYIHNHLIPKLRAYSGINTQNANRTNRLDLAIQAGNVLQKISEQELVNYAKTNNIELVVPKVSEKRLGVLLTHDT